MSYIDIFKEQIRKGLARPNRYNVNITFPVNSFFNSVRSGLMSNAQSLSLMCETAELPGGALATNEDKQFGPIRKMPYLNVYNDITLIFMCDKDMLARSIFDNWHSLIIDKENFKTYYYDDYIGTMDITLLSEVNNQKLYSIRCYECYPIEVISQQLSYNETDTYLRVEVRMAYRNWERTL